jgi:hypothetical protein
MMATTATTAMATIETVVTARNTRVVLSDEMCSETYAASVAGVG